MRPRWEVSSASVNCHFLLSGVSCEWFEDRWLRLGVGEEGVGETWGRWAN